MIGHEPGVEPAALQGLGKADQVLQVEVGVGGGARIAPPGGMDADRAHKGAETQLPHCRHRCWPAAVIPRQYNPAAPATHAVARAAGLRLICHGHREARAVATVVSFVSEKGGVGKTTACYHIAVALKRYHQKNVLVIDADYQRGGITGRFFPQLIERFTSGTIDGTTLFHKYQELYSASQRTSNITILDAPYEKVHVVVADKRLANVSVDKLPSTNNIRENNIALLRHLQVINYVISHTATGYDYVLIDSHPELSDVLRSIIYASDYCVSPVKLDLQSAIGVPSVIAEIDTVNADAILMRNTISPTLQYEPTIFAGAMGMMAFSYQVLSPNYAIFLSPFVLMLKDGNDGFMPDSWPEGYHPL